MSTLKKRRRELRKLRWNVQLTGGGHLRCTRPDIAQPVFVASTPSCCRADRNARAMMRRALTVQQRKPNNEGQHH
jgi:hypothetical protein